MGLKTFPSIDSSDVQSYKAAFTCNLERDICVTYDGVFFPEHPK